MLIHSGQHVPDLTDFCHISVSASFCPLFLLYCVYFDTLIFHMLHSISQTMNFSRTYCIVYSVKFLHFDSTYYYLVYILIFSKFFLNGEVQRPERWDRGHAQGHEGRDGRRPEGHRGGRGGGGGGLRGVRLEGASFKRRDCFRKFRGIMWIIFAKYCKYRLYYMQFS